MNQQVYQNNFLKGMYSVAEDKAGTEKRKSKEAAYGDITQTKEFWSKLAVIS